MWPSGRPACAALGWMGALPSRSGAHKGWRWRWQLSRLCEASEGGWQLAAWWIVIYWRAHLLALSGVLEWAGGREPWTGAPRVTSDPPQRSSLSALRGLIKPPPTEAVSFQGTTVKGMYLFSIFSSLRGSLFIVSWLCLFSCTSLWT